MAHDQDETDGFGPPPTRADLVHMMQLFYESIVTARDEMAMLRAERAEMADALSALHREDLDRVTREIEKIWVEAYAIGRRTGFVPPPPVPEEDPALRRH